MPCPSDEHRHEEGVGHGGGHVPPPTRQYCQVGEYPPRQQRPRPAPRTSPRVCSPLQRAPPPGTHQRLAHSPFALAQGAVVRRVPDGPSLGRSPPPASTGAGRIRSHFLELSNLLEIITYSPEQWSLRYTMPRNAYSSSSLPSLAQSLTQRITSPASPTTRS